MQSLIHKITKAGYCFEILSEFYFRIHHKQTLSGFILLADLNKIFIKKDDTEFCNFCFAARYKNYLESKILVGFSRQNFLCISDLEPLFTDSFLEILNKLSKKIQTLDNSYWNVFDLDKQKIVQKFEYRPFDSCLNCSKIELREIEEIVDLDLNIDHEFLLKISQDLSSEQIVKKSLFLEKFLKNDFGLCSYFNSYSLVDFGLNYYFSTILSNLPSRWQKDQKILCSGISKKKSNAKIKSMMEFAERYAIINQTINSDLFKSSNSEYFTKAFNIINGSEKLIKIGDDSDGKSIFSYNSSNGCAAHFSLKYSIENSMLELVERDAFMRWWMQPEHAISIKPTIRCKTIIKSIKKNYESYFGYKGLKIALLKLNSFLNIPVVLAIASSNDHKIPPSIIAGAGADFNFESSALKALSEVYCGMLNLISRTINTPNWFKNKLNININDVKTATDHGLFYQNPILNAELKFLDYLFNQKSVYEIDEHESTIKNIEQVVDEMRKQNLEWYILDISPKELSRLSVHVIRSIVPSLINIYFGDLNNLPKIEKSELSVAGKLPHCFF